MPQVDEHELARYQAALLELLARDLPTEAMHASLRENAAYAEFRAYVAAFEPRMLTVASELVKKWGKQ
jgi:hypothetical protein